MRVRASARRHIGRLVATISSTILVGPVLIGINAKAQPPQSTGLRPSFEVASIRANHSGDRITNRFRLDHGRFTATNCSPALLIQWAYDVLESQLSGAPNWLKSEGYDIVATAPGDPPVRAFRPMLQRLLEDRFQLKYNWDTKEASLYYLVISKAAKLKQAEAGACPSIFSVPNSPPGVPFDAPCGSLRNTPGHTQGNKLTAGELAASLSFFLQRPVVDKTALTGKYDIELQWTPERGLMQSSPSPDGGPPSIFTALREQLGLKLESAKGPVKTLVIEHIERPSEN